ncbi:MAG: septum formation protein Maf [Clostridia bacterium]|nr:septum formation protein Maf [Clostridia bacterium]
MKFILASKSPRRKEILKKIIPEFETIVSNSDEHLTSGMPKKNQVIEISYQKAKEVFDKTEGDRVVIGSDTMVVKDDVIYGKPKSKENAKELIKQLLSGDKMHEVITGICVLAQKDGKIERHDEFDSARIYFTDITDEEIDAWIATGKAMDKAGAYAIQDEFGVFVEKIEGNYSAVVGLSMPKVYSIIKKYM